MGNITTKPATDKEYRDSLLARIIDDIGGVSSIISAVSFFGTIGEKYIKSKKLKTVILSLKYLISGGAITVRVLSTIKDEVRKKITLSSFDKRVFILSNIMNMSYNIVSQKIAYIHENAFSDEQATWLCSSPKTKDFKIKGMYDGSGEEINNIQNGQESVYVSIEYKHQMFIFLFEFYTLGKDLLFCLNKATIYSLSTYEHMQELERIVAKEFVNSFNLDMNIIEFSERGIKPVPRPKNVIKVTQFDVDEFSEEIRTAIRLGMGRSYLFESQPGCGKTTILKHLQKYLTDTKMVVFNSSTFLSFELNGISSFIRDLGPSIIFFDDADAIGLREKNNIVRSFINVIEELKKCGCIIIMAVNDTSLIHYTIANRAGRVDHAYILKPPEDVNEAILAFSNHLPEQHVKKIKKIIIGKVVGESFTYADIEEVCQKIKLLQKPLTDDTMEKAINKRIEGKKAIKLCNFSNRDPDEKNEAGIARLKI